MNRKSVRGSGKELEVKEKRSRRQLVNLEEDKWKVLVGERKIEEKKWNEKRKQRKFKRGKRKKFNILKGREKRNEIKNENKRKLDKIWEIENFKNKKMTACGI